MRSARRFVIAASCVLGSISACKKSSDATKEEKARKAPVVTPSTTPTKLPQVRPSPFSVTLRFDRGTQESESLLLSEERFREESSRGRRIVRIEHQPVASVLDTVHATFREHACDRITTRVERSTDPGGSILQLHAGAIRHVSNDRGALVPEPQWTDAFAACASSVDEARAQRREQPVARLRLSFADKLPVKTRAELDLGPDHRGLTWDEAQREATVYVATVRPVEVLARVEGETARMLVNLETHAGLSIDVVIEDEQARPVLALLEGPATRIGEVKQGVDARTIALAKPKPGTPEPTSAAPQPKPAKSGPKPATPKPGAGVGAPEHKAAPQSAPASKDAPASD